MSTIRRNVVFSGARRAVLVFAALLPVPASAGWAIEVSSTHDFATEEDGRGNLHLDRIQVSAAAGGMEIQWEDELDVCDPVGSVFAPGFLQAAADVFADLQNSDIDLFLAASSSAPFGETTSDLWGDPTVDWGVTGPTMRVVILDNNPMKSDFSGVFSSNPLGASAALSVWNGSAWGFAKNLAAGDVAEYAILPLSPGTYGAIRNAVPNLDRCPSAETIAHEIGHALGFTEARYRTDPAMSVLEAPTTLPTLWRGVSPFERDPDHTLRLGAYAQSLLWHEYWAPSSGADDWVMQTAVVRADPTQPDNRAVPRSMFQVPEINPQHLVYSDSAGAYLDCVTLETPIYYAQYSETSYASSGCTNTSTLQYVLEDTVVLGTHVETNNCSWSDMWEYQHDEPLEITNGDLLAAGIPLPTLTGVPVDVDLTMQIHPVNAPFEWDPDDNRVTMEVTLYPAGTTDSMCGPQKQMSTTPITDSHYGKAITATQTAITSDMWTATGSPHRRVGFYGKVGEVKVQKWDEEGVEILSVDLDSPVVNGDERFGAAVSMHGNWLVVGAPRAVGEDGRAFLYRRSGDTWTLHTTLVPLGAGSVGRFGTAVAVRQLRVGGVETSVLFVGEPRWGDGGRIAVYTINGTNAPVRLGGIMWTDPGARFGESLSVSNDTLLVGAPFGDGVAVDSGIVRLYEIDPAGATAFAVANPTQTLMAADGAAGDEYGNSVSIEGDVAVVGAPGHQQGWLLFANFLPDAGAAYVYGRGIDTIGPWSYEAKLHLDFAAGGREEGDRFGTSVATFRGNILVGAPQRDLHPNGIGRKVDAGAAFLYSPLKTENFSIRRAFAGLGNNDREVDNRFGAGVALGDRLLFVGAPRADTDEAGSFLANDVGGVRANPYRTFDWVR